MAQRRVTIRDVAAEADVSIASVSLYLNNKPGLADETRARIAKAISALGYVPRRSNTDSVEANYIGLLVEQLPFSALSDMFYGEVIEGIEAHARQHNFNVTLNVLESNDNVNDIIDQHNGALAGMIGLGSGDIDATVVEQLTNDSIPVVMVDHDLPHLPVQCVLPNYIQGAYDATLYLLGRGYERIAFIQGPSKYRSLVERFHGYCLALLDAQKPLASDLVQEPLSAGLPNKGYREMRALLQRGVTFDAVFCVTDRTAFGALDALREAGLRVPEDLAVVGFDDVAQSAYTTPTLTTVRVDKRMMGEVALAQLLHLMDGSTTKYATKILIPTEIIERESV